MAKVEDLHAHYISAGDGPPVVLLHGWGVSGRHYCRLLPLLAESGFSVYALDLLGHGRSARPDRAYAADDYLAHLRRWLEDMRLESPVLVGHSMGGYISISYLLRYPDEFRRLVLIAPLYKLEQLTPILSWGLRPPGLGERLVGGAPAWLVRTFLLATSEDLRRLPREVAEQIASDHKAASPRIFDSLRRLPDLSARVSEVKPPALLIWGQRDSVLKPACYPPLLKRLPTAHSLVLEKAAHSPHISYPQEVCQAIVKFAHGGEA